MINKYNIKTQENNLFIDFENQKTPYILMVFSFAIQYLTVVFVLFYMSNFSTTIILTVVLFATIVILFAIWYFTWALLTNKKLELNHNGATYSKELFGKIKKNEYPWLDIKEFTSTQHRDNYFLTIKQSDDKEIQLFYGVSEIEIKSILEKLYHFKKRIK